MPEATDDRELVPQRSVPVSGFSRDLRDAPDVQRFRFAFALYGDIPVPVHLVFSASLAAAEVKTGDMKALRLAGVTSAEDARDHWIKWWQAGRRKPSPVGPRRAGRYPAPVVRMARA